MEKIKCQKFGSREIFTVCHGEEASDNEKTVKR
jgi:hypothetical protein